MFVQGLLRNIMNRTTRTAACCLLALITSAAAGTLAIDKGKSQIKVDAKATGHSFAGTLSDFTAKVTGDDAPHTSARTPPGCLFV